MISHRLRNRLIPSRYHPVTAFGSYYTPLLYRYFTVTSLLPTVTVRPPLPHHYGPLLIVTHSHRSLQLPVTVGNGR